MNPLSFIPGVGTVYYPPLCQCGHRPSEHTDGICDECPASERPEGEWCDYYQEAQA